MIPHSLLPNAVQFWNAVSLELNRKDHSIDEELRRAPGPGASARALGLIHLAMAEVCANAPDATYKPFRIFQPLGPGFSLDAAIAAAALAVIRSIYGPEPSFERLIGESEGQHTAFLRANASPGVNIDAGLAAGRVVGEQLAGLWSDKDPKKLYRAEYETLGLWGSHDADPGRQDIDSLDPEIRRKARRMYGARWGSADPLLLQRHEVTGLAPLPPPPINSPRYVKDYIDVLGKGRRSNSTRKDDETKIGLFWAYDDAFNIGSTPRLYNQLVNEILTAETKALSISEWARALALCNVAMADAAIVAWWAKYFYNFWRPAVGIRNHARDPKTSPAATMDASWQPLGAPATNAGQLARDFTPNFPSYPSGHAMVGGACFHALTRFRKGRGETDPEKIDLTFLSDELDGESRPAAPRAFKSIGRLIEENSRSRVYLGVNWDFDCEYGAKSGANVATAVCGRAWT